MRLTASFLALLVLCLIRASPLGAGLFTPPGSGFTGGALPDTNYASLNALVAAATAAGAPRVIVTKTNFPVGGVTSIPATMALEIYGGSINLNNQASVLTILGPLLASAQTIFTNFAIDSLSFAGNTSVSSVQLRWWAQCDGITDDLTAIKAATSTNRRVIVPVGTCLTSPYTGMADGGSIWLDGAGRGASVLKLAPNSTAPILQSITLTTPQLVRLENLTLDGNAANQTVNNTGGAQVSANLFIVNNVEITNAKYAIQTGRIIYGAWIQNSWIHDLALHTGVVGNNTAAILMKGPGNTTGEIWITDNIIEQPTASGAGNSVAGIYVAVGNAVAQPVHVLNNTLRKMGQDIATNFIAPIQCYSTCDGTEIRGNKIYDSFYGCIKVQRTSKVIVADNLCDGEATIGTEDSGCFAFGGRSPTTDADKIIVRGNICKNFTNSNGATFVYNSGDELTDVIVKDNIFDTVQSGVYLEYVKGHISVSGNVFRNLVGAGSIEQAIRAVSLDATGSTALHITGNTFDTVNKEAILINEGVLKPVSVLLSNNAFFNITGSPAVNLQYLSSLSIADNVWRGNPTTPLNYSNNTVARVHGNTATNLTVVRTGNGEVADYDNSWAALGAVKLDQLTKNSIFLLEDFPLSTTTSGSIGTLGWFIQNVGSTPTVTRLNSEANHPGIFRLATAATQGQGGSLALGTITSQMFTGLGNTGVWDAYFAFRLNQTTNSRLRVGFLNDFTTSPAATYIGLRYDTASGFTDTNLKFVCRSGASSTVQDSGVAADTNFHTARIRGDGANVYFSLDGGAEATISTNCTTGGVTPALQFITDTNSALSADFDYFSFYQSNLVR